MQGTQARHTIQLIALFSMILVVILVLYEGGVAEIVAIAVLLSYVLNPLVTYLEYRGVPRGIAAGIVLLAVVATGALLWMVLSPIAVEQIHALKAGNASSQAHKVVANIQGLLDDRLDYLGFERIDLNAEVHQLKLGFAERIPGAVIEGSISFAIGLVMTPFLMFFFLKDGSRIKRYFISMVPNRYFEFAMDLLYKMDVQLGNYLRGQFIDALAFGALTTIALWILGVPYFVFIGIFAGLANLIPFVGPIAGALAAVSAVLVEQGDIRRIITVVIVFAVLKLIDDFVVQPMAVGKTVDLHPIAVALGILVAGHLFGVMGMLLIVPLMGFLKVVLEESVQTYRRYRFD